MFSSSFFSSKKKEVPVFKEQKLKTKKRRTNFWTKNNDNMSNVEKYEKAYEQN